MSKNAKPHGFTRKLRRALERMDAAKFVKGQEFAHRMQAAKMAKKVHAIEARLVVKGAQDRPLVTLPDEHAKAVAQAAVARMQAAKAKRSNHA